MKWTPEDQISIFDALDNRKYLEERHFDTEQTNPNFVYYLQANGKRVGDPYSLYQAQKWIEQQVSVFKKKHGRTDMDPLREIGHDWPELLREFLQNVASENKCS